MTKIEIPPPPRRGRSPSPRHYGYSDSSSWSDTNSGARASRDWVGAAAYADERDERDGSVQLHGQRALSLTRSSVSSRSRRRRRVLAGIIPRIDSSLPKQSSLSSGSNTLSFLGLGITFAPRYSVRTLISCLCYVERGPYEVKK